MFAIAARRMGYRVHTFSPETDTPTGQAADVEVVAEYDDLEALRAFARQVDVVTFEFEIVQYEPFENRHRDHILDVTTVPAAIPPALAARAAEITRDILHELQYVGGLCVEFFVDTDGELLVNEIAPRPHNSGHLSFNAASTSQ